MSINKSNHYNSIPESFKNHSTSPQISFIFSVSSLIVSIASVLCNDINAAHMNPSSVSYPENYAPPAESAQRQTHAARRAELHSSEFYPVRHSAALEQQATQPSVYHSIIDRTNGPILNASPAIQTAGSSMGDLNTAAGHHHGHAYGKYYEHRSVPHKKTWKYGYKRGNHKHTISRHEHGKAGKHPHFKTKVKWHDKKSKGKGIHLWDYNHYDKKHYHHG